MPLEVETLRFVQPAVVLISALALGLAVLRDNGDARPVATLLLFTHAVTWILLREPVARAAWIARRVAAECRRHLGAVRLGTCSVLTCGWTAGSASGRSPGRARDVEPVHARRGPLVHGPLVHRRRRAGLGTEPSASRPHRNGVASRGPRPRLCAGRAALLWILDVALSPGNALGGGFLDAVTGEHFQKMLSSESFWIWTRNSVIVSVGTTLLGLALAIPAGYAFSRFKFRGRDPAMFAFLLVQMFPGVIILVPYFLVMKALGLLNTSFGLILAYSVTALPLCVWMLKGFFDTVPREPEEAALMDGCSQTQVFWKIVLPLSLPAVAVTALFSFLAAWNEFLLALTFNTSESMYTLPVGLASLISSTGQHGATSPPRLCWSACLWWCCSLSSNASSSKG